MKRLTAFFSGRVQGVGFRFTAQGLARRFRVTGFVRNLEDGRVELVAEGEQGELEGLLNAIHRSEMETHIQDTQTRWSEAEGVFKQFSIAF